MDLLLGGEELDVRRYGIVASHSERSGEFLVGKRVEAGLELGVSPSLRVLA